MPERVVGVQPAVLKWAREQAGYSLDDVARALKKDADDIDAWEHGKSAPTYVQLEKLAYQIYRRPIAVFFFPAPPPEPAIKESFRTLPEFEIERLSSDTRYILRYAHAMQLALAELNDGINPAERKIFLDIRPETDASISRTAAKIREYLEVSLEEQASWKSSDEALNQWRERVENTGIFVFKRAFKQKDISGFCLLDKEFPIIYLNNSNAKTRQVFSLFHEMAHILFQVNGITKDDDRYIHDLPSGDRRIEESCNRLASEILVPSSDFEKRIQPGKTDDVTVANLARRYSVSREVILRKMVDRGLVDRAYYEKKAAQWVKEYLESKQKSESGGGDYYRTQAAYLGNKYLGLVFGKYYQGRISVEQVADYLGVKSRSVAGLEHVFENKVVSA